MKIAARKYFGERDRPGRTRRRPADGTIPNGRDGSPSRPLLFNAETVASARRPYLFPGRRHGGVTHRE
jgi:hypothetical protein